mmetsp:Transcript_53513/g.150319  ORF Transcript_53513/g.150319 Transcript_53513/m.150319 type:complete len:907 (-) Transcript_53513:133-2853(-)
MACARVVVDLLLNRYWRRGLDRCDGLRSLTSDGTEGPLDSRQPILRSRGHSACASDTDAGETPRNAKELQFDMATVNEPNEPRLDRVPLMGEGIVIDDKEVALVFIFPRGTGRGGILDPDEVVVEPMRKAWRIFGKRGHDSALYENLWGEKEYFGDLKGQWQDLCRSSEKDTGKLVDAFSRLLKPPVTQQVFQQVVRETILDILDINGIVCSRFESIDCDEVFVKLHLPTPVLEALAEEYQYSMPFTAEAYAEMPRLGMHPAGQPMRDRRGGVIFAYTPFTVERRELLQPFRHVDEIRILERRLRDWLSLSELQNQMVITRYFTAANFDDMKELHRTWSGMCAGFRLTERQMDSVRDYFGEQVAFFFRFAQYFIKMLAPLALLSALVFLRNLPALNLSLARRRVIQLFFSVVLVGWSCVFAGIFRVKACRERVRWGMDNFEATTHDRVQYSRALEGTWQLRMQLLLRNTFFVVFIVSFVVLISFEDVLVGREMDGAMRALQGHGALFTTVTIRVVSTFWGYVSPWLADLGNPRTNGRWSDDLTWILASVKVFVALFPFANLAFLRQATHSNCFDGDITDIAWNLFGAAGVWPEGVVVPNMTNINGTISIDNMRALAFLKPFTYHSSSGQMCIKGCVPSACFLRDRYFHNSDVPVCVTDCLLELEHRLSVFFLTHCCLSVVFLAIPMIGTWWEVRKELQAVNQRLASSEENEDGGESASQKQAQYSLMQFQAKCPEYAYGSWGGSFTEDFLELVIGFALFTCFGIVLPVMGVMLLVALYVEYRMLAFRMTAVTCRPRPEGAEGIGTWQGILEKISLIAITTNSMIAVFVNEPMCEWSQYWQLLAFVVLEHLGLALHVVLMSTIPKMPPDILRCQDFNSFFQTQMIKKKPFVVAAKDRTVNADIDIGL